MWRFIFGLSGCSLSGLCTIFSRYRDRRFTGVPRQQSRTLRHETRSRLSLCRRRLQDFPVFWCHWRDGEDAAWFKPFDRKYLDTCDESKTSWEWIQRLVDGKLGRVKSRDFTIDLGWWRAQPQVKMGGLSSGLCFHLWEEINAEKELERHLWRCCRED